MNNAFATATLAATLMIAGCTTTAPERAEEKDPSKTASTATQVNLFKQGNWVFDQFDAEWVSIPGKRKTYAAPDSVLVTADCSGSAFFGLDGLFTNPIGEFDSIRIEYKSNYAFQVVCATSDDKNGWESIPEAPKSQDNYQLVTFKKADFRQTWGSAISPAIADIFAFTNDSRSVLTNEPLNLSVRSVILYR